jgi:hypothetical protein
MASEDVICRDPSVPGLTAQACVGADDVAAPAFPTTQTTQQPVSQQPRPPPPAVYSGCCSHTACLRTSASTVAADSNRGPHNTVAEILSPAAILLHSLGTGHPYTLQHIDGGGESVIGWGTGCRDVRTQLDDPPVSASASARVDVSSPLAYPLEHATSNMQVGNFALKATESSVVDLSAEVRVLCHAKGCLKLAFRTRQHVYFSPFTSTLLWAFAFGLCTLAVHGDLEWQASWVWRLAAYESQSLGACLLTFFGFWILLAARCLLPEQDTVLVDIEGVPADMSHYVTRQACSCQGGPATSHRVDAVGCPERRPEIHMHGRWSVSKMPHWWPEVSPDDAHCEGSLGRVLTPWQRCLQRFAVTRLVSDAPISDLMGCQVPPSLRRVTSLLSCPIHVSFHPVDAGGVV